MLVSLASTGGGVLFQGCVLFNKENENAKFWPGLANFGNFFPNFRTFWWTFIGLNSAVLYQK